MSHSLFSDSNAEIQQSRHDVFTRFHDASCHHTSESIVRHFQQNRRHFESSEKQIVSSREENLHSKAFLLTEPSEKHTFVRSQAKISKIKACIHSFMTSSSYRIHDSSEAVLLLCNHIYYASSLLHAMNYTSMALEHDSYGNYSRCLMFQWRFSGNKSDSFIFLPLVCR